MQGCIRGTPTVSMNIIFKSVSFHEGNFFCFFSKKGKHVFQLIPIDVLLWKLVWVLHTHEDGYYKDKQTSKKQTKKQKISVGEYVEKLEPLCNAGGNVKWYSHTENRMGILQKNYHTNMELPCDPSIPLLGISPPPPPKLKAGFCIICNRYLYTSVYSNIFHKSQKVETT